MNLSHLILLLVNIISRDWVENEKRLQPKARFPKAWSKLLAVVNEMLKINSGWKILVETKTWLAS